MSSLLEKTIVAQASSCLADVDGNLIVTQGDELVMLFDDIDKRNPNYYMNVFMRGSYIINAPLDKFNPSVSKDYEVPVDIYLDIDGDNNKILKRSNLSTVVEYSIAADELLYMLEDLDKKYEKF